MRQQKEIWVSLALKSQKSAGGWRSVFLVQKAPDSLQWQFDYLQFDPVESWTITYSDQVFFWSNLPLTKFFLSSHTFGFSIFVFSLGWKIFSSTISTPYDLLVFLPNPPNRLGGFLLMDPLSGFSPQFSTRFRRFFPSNITIWDSLVSLQG